MTGLVDTVNKKLQLFVDLSDNLFSAKCDLHKNSTGCQFY